ncbi:hypothetical protein HF668_04090, partial [Acidithiobacillus ferridurans]|nr:hypothetical protein [Acidithiobacillus ferridurans]
MSECDNDNDDPFNNSSESSEPSHSPAGAPVGVYNGMTPKAVALRDFPREWRERLIAD